SVSSAVLLEAGFLNSPRLDDRDFGLQGREQANPTRRMRQRNAAGPALIHSPNASDPHDAGPWRFSLRAIGRASERKPDVGAPDGGTPPTSGLRPDARLLQSS